MNDYERAFEEGRNGGPTGDGVMKGHNGIEVIPLDAMVRLEGGAEVTAMEALLAEGAATILWPRSGRLIARRITPTDSNTPVAVLGRDEEVKEAFGDPEAAAEIIGIVDRAARKAALLCEETALRYVVLKAAGNRATAFALEECAEGLSSKRAFNALAKRAEKLFEAERIVGDALGREGPIISDARAYRDIARAILNRNFNSPGGLPTLVHWRGEFFSWCGTHWVAVTLHEPPNTDDVYLAIHDALSDAVKIVGRGEDAIEVPFNPSTTEVVSVRRALIGMVLYRREDQSWIDGRDGSSHVATLSGILDLNTLEAQPPTPAFFNTYCVGARIRSEWLRDEAAFREAWVASHSHAFLKQIFDRDPAQVDLLTEVLGYLVLGDNTYQKGFMLVGPPRSGKGTISQIINHLLPKPAVASPKIKDLDGPFALQGMEYARVATINDARLEEGSPSFGAMAELLLSSIGNDATDVPRKFKTTLRSLQLKIRWLIVSNAVPRLRDRTGVLSQRFIYLTTSTSFLGREDTDLLARLRGEIDLWFAAALHGYRRLVKRGSFAETNTHRTTIMRIQIAMAPIASFLASFTEEDEQGFIAGDDLYAVFMQVARTAGIARWGRARFAERVLAEKAGKVRKSRPRIERVTFGADGKPKTDPQRLRGVSGLTWKPTLSSDDLALLGDVEWEDGPSDRLLFDLREEVIEEENDEA
jgi:putative DNA primase/helicase